MSDDNDRDSKVGLTISVAIEFNRKRGIYSDKWEARFATVAIAIITAIILIYMIIQIFLFLARLG